MNYAFNEDHVSIIDSKEVMQQYNAIINNFEEEKSGYITIRFSYDYPPGSKKPFPQLVLQPLGKKNAETIIELRAEDNGRRLGPFPPGEYLATFGALTARGGKNVPVTVAVDNTSELEYVLTPDNIVYGTLTSALQSKDWAVGMPYEQNFAIQSITLDGAGGQRQLPLLSGEDVSVYDSMVARNDFYYQGNFVFFGLAPGEYELVIRAKGYRPFVQKCVVESGRLFDPLLVELTAE